MAGPVFYFSDGPYLQVLQGLVRALSQPEALVKLLGNPRTGKSLLCEKLAYFMRHKDFRVVYIHFAIDSPETLRTLLARELNLPTASNFSRMLEELPAAPDGKSLILIFDDAHLLADETLLEIYRIAQIQSGPTRVLNVVLCGEPALDKKLLGRRELRSLRMQMSHTLALAPMTREVLERFIMAYLGKAGMPGLQLEAAAQRYLFNYCRGYPGPALELCQLIVAARRGSVELSVITRQELAELVRQAQGAGGAGRPVASQTRGTKRWLLVGALAALVVAALALLYVVLAGDDDGAGSALTRVVPGSGAAHGDAEALTLYTAAAGECAPASARLV